MSSSQWALLLLLAGVPTLIGAIVIPDTTSRRTRSGARGRGIETLRALVVGKPGG